MKKVFKVNFGVVMAVCAAFSLMSFKMANYGSEDEAWYAVNPTNGDIEQPALPSGPGDVDDDCIETLTTNICAVFLPKSHQIENIDDLPSGTPTAGRTD